MTSEALRGDSGKCSPGTVCSQGTSALGRPGWGRDCCPGGELTQRPCNPSQPLRRASRDPALAPGAGNPRRSAGSRRGPRRSPGAASWGRARVLRRV